MNIREKSAQEKLHPFAIAFYLFGQIVLGMFVLQPIFVAVSLFFAVLTCFYVCGRGFAKELKFYIPFYIIVALSNPLFSHSGATVMFFMNGKPITYEATVYGIVSSGMFLGVLLWCRVWSAIITEEKLVYLVGRKLPKIGLVLSVTLRMIPRFRRKWREIYEVQTTLGRFSEKGFVTKIKDALQVFSALITQAMESSVETGMSMTARGYGVGKRTSFALYRFRRSDAIFMIFDVVSLAILIVCIALGFTEFSFYPTLSPVVQGRWATGVFVLFAIRSAYLLLLGISEEVSWKYSRSKM